MQEEMNFSDKNIYNFETCILDSIRTIEKGEFIYFIYKKLDEYIEATLNFGDDEKFNVAHSDLSLSDEFKKIALTSTDQIKDGESISMIHHRDSEIITRTIYKGITYVTTTETKKSVYINVTQSLFISVAAACISIPWVYGVYKFIVD